MSRITWSFLGQMPYRSAWNLQEELRKKILDGSGSEKLLLVEHSPTISLGRAEKGSNINVSLPALTEQGFDVVESNRGGKVTYHGPGQLVAYPIVNLKNLKLGVKQYVAGLEETMIQTLRAYNLPAEKREGCPGAWLSGKKIGSIGVHIRKQVSIHGISLNVAPNLSHFEVMTPCGISGVQMTSMKNEGLNFSVRDVLPTFIKSFESVFKIEVVPETLESVGNV